MALKMINPCKDCPEYATCKGVCPKLKKMLPSEAPATERPISEFLRKKKKRERDEWKDVPHLDKIKKKKLGAYLGDQDNQDSAWESVFIATADEWTKEDKEALEQSIHQAFRYGGETKLKRRFLAFLRCQGMTSIAQSANTSKQNIQQSFQRVVKKIAKKCERVDKLWTPLKFKSMIPEWE